MTREKFVFWVVATLLVFGLLSQGQEWVRASFLAFLMPFPLWLMLPACSGSSGNSVLPWARGCGCCTALHPLFFFLGWVFFCCGKLWHNLPFMGLGKGSSNMPGWSLCLKKKTKTPKKSTENSIHQRMNHNLVSSGVTTVGACFGF